MFNNEEIAQKLQSLAKDPYELASIMMIYEMSDHYVEELFKENYKSTLEKIKQISEEDAKMDQEQGFLHSVTVAKEKYGTKAAIIGSIVSDSCEHDEFMKDVSWVAAKLELSPVNDSNLMNFE